MTKIKVLFTFLGLVTSMLHAQEDAQALKENKKLLQESTNITYEANKALSQNNFVGSEAEYRKAISKSDANAAAPYNLGRAYYNRNAMAESFTRFKEAGEKAEAKETKHKSYHNMGNVFMRQKEYQKAVEAYKQALRNDHTDDETRYNLALAKEMLKNEQDQNQDNQNQDQNQDQNKDQNKDNQEQNQNQNQNGDQDKDQDGEQKDDQNKDEGDQGDKGQEKPEENKEGEGDKKEEQKKQPNQGQEPERKERPRPNQLSKQQIQNLLEAMQNEEKKVQEKIDAKKVKGQKIKNEKDW